MRVKISADSTCDLSPELIEQYNVGISPLYIVRDGQDLIDGKEINPDDIFAYVAASGRICSTAAVSVADYMKFFADELRDHDAVVHMCISSDMSCCYQNAMVAAREFENVYPIDSRNLSTGIGHLVIDAADMAAGGMAAKDIAAELDRRKEKLDVSFVLDTLNYLYKGGRCSALTAFGANMLNLKPCIEVKNGTMGVGKKYRGALGKCFVKYIEDRLKDQTDIDYRRIFITDSGIAPEIYEELEATVRACGPFENVYHTRAGCTISNHCGPNCMGILYYKK